MPCFIGLLRTHHCHCIIFSSYALSCVRQSCVVRKLIILPSHFHCIMHGIQYESAWKVGNLQASWAFVNLLKKSNLYSVNWLVIWSMDGQVDRDRQFSCESVSQSVSLSLSSLVLKSVTQCVLFVQLEGARVAWLL
jgi:hypothetical protein